MMFPEWYESRTPEQGLSPRRAIEDPQGALGLAFEEVEFSAVDGSVLRGWLIPGNPHATAGIVAVHGGGADRRHFLFTVPMFHEAGYPVLLFDCREQGISESRGRGVGFGVREYADTISAVDFVKQETGLQRIAVVGSSQGAVSAIIAAALDPDIDVVIAENPFSDLHAMLRDTRSELGAPPEWLARLIAYFARVRLRAGELPSPIEAAPGISPRPMLLMHGTKDMLIPQSHSEAILAVAGPSAQLWIAEDAEHSSLYRKYPDEWKSHVMSFLEETLGPAGP